MKKHLVTFLQAVVIFVGVITLILMLWEPHLEGRNANSTTFQIYFNDPFLAFAYIASIPFFVALFQLFKVLEYAKHKKLFSEESVKSVRTIKYCGLTLIGFAVIAEIFIFLGSSDDRAGGVFMGNLVILSSIIIAVSASKFERALRKELDKKLKS